MKKRVLCAALLVLSAIVAQGCCWCHRPFLFPRLHYWHGCDPCCTTSCAGPSCCGTVGGDVYLGAPIPSVPSPGPTMPGATPLTRAQFHQAGN